MKTKKSTKNETMQVAPQMKMEQKDYNLSLLSEANGMTLLVSQRGQVFVVDKKERKLVALNKGLAHGKQNLYK